MKNCLFTYLFLISCASGFAQDTQMTQFYAAPQYLNPAFTGLTAQHRFAANYRNQWTGITKAYQTLFAAYDYNISQVNSGVGFFAMQDRAGLAGLSHTQAGLSYSYRFTVRKLSEIRTGLSISYNMKSLSFNKLTFNDQLVTGSGVSIDAGTYQPKNYVDINAGALFNSEKYWLGVSAKHLNRPNVSLIGQQELLPILLGVHGGYRYIIESKGSTKTGLRKYVAASFNYRHQLKYDQFDVGFYYFHMPINLGIWYRGIPFKNYSPYINNESIAILLGCEIPQRNLRIGYSYDLTISSLGVSNTLGSHEITLVYEYAKKSVYKARKVLVTCPKF